MTVHPSGVVLELHARAGQAVLVRCGDGMPQERSDVQAPTGLGVALDEWALVAEEVRRSGDCEGERGVLVSRRGQVLAARLASSVGVPVSYTDPITGWTDLVSPEADREPAPWATGLPVSAATAVLMVVALLALSDGLAAMGGWLVVLANVLVAAGLAPSIWLGRALPIWRWVTYGTVAGIVLAWLALPLILLG